ncbi:aminotransferase class I/II-fold pyridoxal phosphate-dependent enzyme [Photobacterium leiognathi subsp. mandapamensis]
MFSMAVDSTQDCIAKIANEIRQDPCQDAVNLSLGYYSCEEEQSTGFTVLPSTSPEHRQTPSLAVLGNPRYRTAISRLLDTGILPPHTSVQTLGATGALSLALSILKQYEQCNSVWISEPSWGNHTEIAHSAGVKSQFYPYKWDAKGTLDLESIITALSSMENNDALIIQGCCHNPTGIDLSIEQLRKLAVLANRKGAKIIIDFAYFGLAEGVDEDRRILNALASELPHFFVATSFSKSLGLYSERLGALTYFSHQEVELTSFMVASKRHIRASHSMPPQHIAGLVADVLESCTLKARWSEELAKMRDTIKRRKLALFAALESHHLAHLVQNPTSNGMFVTLALNSNEIKMMKNRHRIYLLPNGRMSVASLQLQDIPRCIEAIVKVKNDLTGKDS